MAKKTSNGLSKVAIASAAATLIPSPITAAVAFATAIKNKDDIKNEILDIYDKKEEIDQKHLKTKTTTTEASFDPETGLPRVRRTQKKEYK